MYLMTPGMSLMGRKRSIVDKVFKVTSVTLSNAHPHNLPNNHHN